MFWTVTPYSLVGECRRFTVVKTPELILLQCHWLECAVSAVGTEIVQSLLWVLPIEDIWQGFNCEN
jgi:hypothetical protein